MIPMKLSDWTIPIIEDLLTKGYHETEFYDFKEKLPHAKDDYGKLRLRKSCCSFANSAGGFLVFGIADKRTKTIEERLVGMGPSIDLPVLFGSYPKDCEPSIDWTFLDPPLKLPNGNVIHVIQIARSWAGPHCCRSLKDQTAFLFSKRTNQGDAAMSYEEVRAGFLGYYEKRLKLQLLIGELEAIRDSATRLVPPEEQRSENLSAEDFQLQVLESVLADTYTILADDPELLRLLAKIRTACRGLNTPITSHLQPSCITAHQQESVSQAAQ
jgi:hypothetical protein